jgi:hypothetical protein
MHTSTRGIAALAVLVVGLCSPPVAPAESRPPLESVVRRDVLIVKCKMEIKDETIHYRVLESWKGKYDPTIFYQTPPDGYMHRGISAGMFSSPKDGTEVIMFYSDNAISGDRNNPGKIDAYRPDDVLPVVNGKVEYELNELGSEVYTLAEFKKAVLAVVAKQAKEKADARK